MAPIVLSEALYRILSTNHVPLPHEADALKVAIRLEESHVSVLDEEIEQLRQRLDVLEVQKLGHMKRIEALSAPLSPVRALPPEILGRIFLACLDSYQKDPPSSRWQKHPAYLLSQICRRWRSLAVGYPRLWSVIDIWLPIHPLRLLRKRYQMSPAALPREEQDTCSSQITEWDQRMHSIHDMLKLSLVRSSNLLLTISLGGKAIHERPDDDVRCPLWSIISTLLSAYARLEDVSFKLKIEHPSCPLTSLLSVDYNDIPSLKRAQLGIKLGTMAEDASSSLLLNLKGPLLTTIDLKMRWYFANILADLTTIDLKMRWYFANILADGIDWSVLTVLSLCTLGRDDVVTPHVAEVVDMLRRCPRIIQCELEIEHQDHNTEHLALPDHREERYPVTLAHLRSLGIYGCGGHLFLSRVLDLPSLEEMHTVNTGFNPFNGAEEVTPDGILPWAEKYGSQLRHVLFEYGYLSQAQLLRTLECLAGVESLKVSGVVDYDRVGLEQDAEEGVFLRWEPPARLSDDVLRLLTPDVENPTRPCFCPRLRKFWYTSGDLDFNLQGLLEFIVKRRTVEEEGESGVSRLKEVALTLSAPMTLDFKDELRDRGINVDAFDFKVVYVKEE